jgi:hypothetical protein
VLTSYWTGVGDKLADRWVAAILSPAFLIWGGGFVAAGQVDYLATRFGERTGTEQAAIIVGAFVPVAVSGFVDIFVQRRASLASILTAECGCATLEEHQRCLSRL